MKFSFGADRAFWQEAVEAPGRLLHAAYCHHADSHRKAFVVEVTNIPPVKTQCL